MKWAKPSSRVRDVALLLFMMNHLASVGGAESIAVPFGLEWGMSTRTMERVLRNQPVRLTLKRQINDREAWTLEGFQQENLERAVIYFDRKGRMNEVELQYQRKDWSPEKYEGQAISLRRKFERAYGEGRLIVRTRRQDGSATFSIEGYEWRSADVILRLIHFAARQKSEAYNNISVHYKLAL
jgi:hypothetical protein